jgi:hypothetical protein
MRHLSRLLPGAALAALILSIAAVTATAAVRANNNGHGNGNSYGNGNGNGNNWNSSGNGNGTGNANAAPPATQPATSAPSTPPGQANKTAPGASATAPGQVKKAPTAATTTTTPATTTTDTQTTPVPSSAPTPLPPAVAPVIGESMGLKPAGGTVQVRLPQSSGFVSLAAAGSIPSGAVVDARAGTVVLRTAIDASGRTQAATIRGAVFEIRQSATGKGMTDLVLRDGRQAGCPATGGAAAARAALAHGLTTKAKPSSGGLWAQDRNGRFRSRGRNSVATVRGTRWVTRETCAGTLTRVMDGAVDVFDLRTHRTVRVSAGHSYLARTSG